MQDLRAMKPRGLGRTLFKDSDMLPEAHLLVTFFAASILLAVTPGPGVVYIVTRTMSQGRASGLASVAGVALGNFANAFGASAGLATLFAVSSVAFTVVKWTGAAYLVYLGLRMWQTQPKAGMPANIQPHPLGRIFRDGFTVALLNPKTALFFAAFLPQFLSPGASAFVQSVALGGVFGGIALVTDAAYALGACYVAPRLLGSMRTAKFGNRLAGSSFIGLGVLTALGGRPGQ